MKLKIKKKITNFVLDLPAINFIVVLLKRYSLPGFNKLSIWNVGSFFIKGLFKGDINQRSAALAFTFFLSLFPMIISFFTIIPYIPIENFQNTLLNTLSEVVPASTWQMIEKLITDIVSRQRGGLLSISFLFAIYLATNGMMGISKAFNHSYHGVENRSRGKQRLISLLLVSIIAVLIIIAMVFIIIGKFAINYLLLNGLLNNDFALWTLIISRWLIVLALIFFAISFIYFLAPANEKFYKFFSPGSILASFLGVVLLVGFDAYITNFTSYNLLYGSIGTIIVMLVWLFFNSFVLLLGFELNVSIYKAKQKIK